MLVCACVCALANNAFCLMINCNAILGGRCFPQTRKHTHTQTRYVQLWNVCRDAGTGGYIICDIKLLILSQIQIESESEATIEPGGDANWAWAWNWVGPASWCGLGPGWCRASLDWAKPFEIGRKSVIRLSLLMLRLWQLYDHWQQKHKKYRQQSSEVWIPCILEL